MLPAELRKASTRFMNCARGRIFFSMIFKVCGASANQCCAGSYSMSEMPATIPSRTSISSTALALRGTCSPCSISTGPESTRANRQASAIGTNATWAKYSSSPIAPATRIRTAVTLRFSLRPPTGASTNKLSSFLNCGPVGIGLLFAPPFFEDHYAVNPRATLSPEPRRACRRMPTASSNLQPTGLRHNSGVNTNLRAIELRRVIGHSLVSWFKDDAPSMGAALAFYTLFAIAPILLIFSWVAGEFFRPDVVQQDILAQLRLLLGDAGAEAVRDLLGSAKYAGRSAFSTVAGIVAVFVGATSVFAELQSALHRIWRTPPHSVVEGLWRALRSRLLSFGLVLGIGFLLLLSLIATDAFEGLDHL